VGSHAAALRSQGVSQEIVDAIGTGRLDSVKLEAKDAALLLFVRHMTLTPADVKDADVEAMRAAGWTDEQIWEAALEVGFFSLFNRMADLYGLDYPTSGWLPPEQRQEGR
jgi:alkylhydroperoxidase family enzyme